MLSKELTEAFLQLIRLGIGHLSPGELKDRLELDWTAIEALAVKQGLSAIVLDGLDRLQPSAYDMPAMMRKKWIGEVLHWYENRFELYRRAIAEMASFYSARGYRMMLLKGYACSLDWPKPKHRPTGDIDIWLFGQPRKLKAITVKLSAIWKPCVSITATM